MKVAALYDVHAMPWALDVVLVEVEREGVDEVLFGGDLVGGPCPARTLELARATNGRFVRGNHERDLSAWDAARLRAGDRDWLAGLPMTVALDGVLYCHSTPTDDLPLLTAVTPDEALIAAFAGFEEGTVVIGHTHHQFDRRVRGLRVVNAGSVGMPYEGEVAAFWLLVEDGEPSFRRTAFDVERAVAELREAGWPPGEEFVAENLLDAPSREEGIAYFEARRG